MIPLTLLVENSNVASGRLERLRIPRLPVGAAARDADKIFANVNMLAPEVRRKKTFQS
jgi:hypothetical protein